MRRNIVQGIDCGFRSWGVATLHHDPCGVAGGQGWGGEGRGLPQEMIKGLDHKKYHLDLRGGVHCMETGLRLVATSGSPWHNLMCDYQSLQSKERDPTT